MAGDAGFWIRERTLRHLSFRGFGVNLTVKESKGRGHCPTRRGTGEVDQASSWVRTGSTPLSWPAASADARALVWDGHLRL